MLDLVALAQELGFDLAAPIDTADIVTREELANSCSPRTCPRYASCWSCPPGAGTLEQRQAHFDGKSGGVIVQTKQEGVDFYEDFDVLEKLHRTHNSNLDKLTHLMRQEYDGVTEFSTGGCGQCDTCTYPDEPCRKPREQRLSISAHGIDVDATCKNAQMEYSFENGTIRFIGIVLHE